MLLKLSRHQKYFVKLGDNAQIFLLDSGVNVLQPRVPLNGRLHPVDVLEVGRVKYHLTVFWPQLIPSKIGLKSPSMFLAPTERSSRIANLCLFVFTVQTSHSLFFKLPSSYIRTVLISALALNILSHSIICYRFIKLSGPKILCLRLDLNRGGMASLSLSISARTELPLATSARMASRASVLFLITMSLTIVSLRFQFSHWKNVNNLNSLQINNHCGFSWQRLKVSTELSLIFAQAHSLSLFTT